MVAKAGENVPIMDVGEDSQVPSPPPKTPEPIEELPPAPKRKRLTGKFGSDASDASISYDRGDDGSLLPSNLNAAFDKVAPQKQA